MSQSPDARFVLVPSRQWMVTFGYKDETGNTQTIKELGPINIPNYQTALENLSAERHPLAKNPIYTHMTRL